MTSSTAQHSDDENKAAAVSIGVVVETPKQLLDYVNEQHFQFGILPLLFANSDNNDSSNNNDDDDDHIRSDHLLTSDEWSVLVVGRVAEWLELDSNVPHTRRKAELAFMKEVSWAIHLSLPAILMPTPSTTMINNNNNYARCVNQACHMGARFGVWIPLPFASSISWRTWHNIHAACEYSMRVGVVLILSNDDDDDDDDDGIDDDDKDDDDDNMKVDRWLGEPVRAISLALTTFVTNAAGYPVLRKRHQRIISALLEQQNVQVILHGTPQHRKGIKPYQYYIRWLRTQPVTTTAPTASSQQLAFANLYRDYLQSPLQPLGDNLQSVTYETFEQDHVKYAQYKAAVYAALTTKYADRQDTIVVTVAGAGRGPLVNIVLLAADDARKQVHVYAVEKNPNAIITLRSSRRRMWGARVTVMAADMRSWSAPQPVDILVSELLGSFGDNELSPECLDGVQQCLKVDGISIPYKSTSYIVPVGSARLWNTVHASSGGTVGAFETPYVVRMHSIHHVADEQPCFTFVHPSDSAGDNARFQQLRFTSKHASVVHGFAGYFEAWLYDDITVSIRPNAAHTPDMFSWFPLLLPLRTPVLVDKEVELSIWRCVSEDERRVWYEWMVTTPTVRSTIHNPNGRSSHIRL